MQHALLGHALSADLAQAPRLQVRYSPGTVGPRALLQAVNDAGFTAQPASEEHADGSALREREKQVWEGLEGHREACCLCLFEGK